jgi:AhpD family alkylhydroperoxidase
MFDARFDPTVSAAYQGLYAVSTALEKSVIPAELKHLIDLSVSTLNGCAFCCDLHVQWGARDGVPARKMQAVSAWRDSVLFSPAEKAAFAWAEILTGMKDHQVDAGLQELRLHWNDAEIAELSMMTAIINAWNRIGVSAYAEKG